MYLKDSINKRSYQDIIFISLLMALLSQMYLEPVMSDFRISIAIILLPIYYYIAQGDNIIKIGFISATFVYLMRILTYFLKLNLEIEALITGIRIFFPEIFFYVGYCVSFNLLIKRVKYKNINKITLICFITDFISNSVEIVIREVINIQDVTIGLILGLVIFALLRSALIWIILNIIDRYKILLLKKEHEKRYKSILYTISKLKSELYLMEKSMKSTEEVMSKAYNLYSNIENNEQIETWGEKSLDIAKDIHEIKKENYLVLKGLETIFDNNKDEKGLYVNEIYDILNTSLKVQLEKENNKDIRVYFKNNAEVYTTKHYLIISILRNLIMNAIEAIDKNGCIYILHNQYIIEGCDYLVFEVKDEGKGIRNDEIEYIFSPGFSTKIDYETGHINRGLGLSIVKEIVENKLKGFIKVESEEGQGTKFIIYIPKSELEEVNDEYSNC